MKHNRILSQFFIISVFMTFSLLAMDGQSLPSISFKHKTREELNQYALEHEVRDLTPRSKQSLEDRVQELGINKDSRDFIYTALASDGSRPVSYDTTPFIFARLAYLVEQEKSKAKTTVQKQLEVKSQQ